MSTDSSLLNCFCVGSLSTISRSKEETIRTVRLIITHWSLQTNRSEATNSWPKSSGRVSVSWPVLNSRAAANRVLSHVRKLIYRLPIRNFKKWIWFSRASLPVAANNTTRSTSRRWHYIVPEIPQQFAAAVRRKWTSSQYGNTSRQLVAGCGLLQQLHPSRHGMENKHCRPIRRHGQRRTVYPTHQIFTNCNRHFITHRFRPLPAFIDQTWFCYPFLMKRLQFSLTKCSLARFVFIF